MIPIKIDDENIAFRDLHFDKVKNSIQDLLRGQLDKKDIQSFEREFLTWILGRLDWILLSETSELREFIQQFNKFTNRYNNDILLSLSNIRLKKSRSELKNITVPYLKKICIFNDINSIVSKPKKDDYINSIMAVSIDYIPISSDTKFYLLNKRIKSIISNVFIDFYEKKWDDIAEYDRYTFVTKHNLKTCPYCNMGYILISERNKKKENGLRPEIDHFFPKSEYPYLAMSFYNLIPSCKVCNHTKGNKDTYKDELLSPYEIDESTFKMTYRPKNMNFLQVEKRKYNTNNFEIEIKDKNNKKDDEDKKDSNDYFKLDKLYAQHKDVVLELLVKRTIYSKSYIAELKKNFHLTDDEIYRFLFCNYKDGEEFSKRPLSKLIKDITDELGFKRVGL